MSVFRITASSSGVARGEGDVVFVTRSGDISSVGYGISFSGPVGAIDGGYVHIDGSVIGREIGLHSNMYVHVVIGASGQLAGNSGLQVDGDLTLRNYGTISGIQESIYASGKSLVLNYGTLNGDVQFSSAGESQQEIRNSGSIVGDVVLDFGDDIYTAVGNGSVTGTIYGGYGDDVFSVGRADEIIDGGEGNDRVVVSGARGASIDLKTQIGGGVSAGDAYSSIEALYGSSFGADTLAGSTGDDLIAGRGGSDILTGAEGADRLTGGLGADTLSGQAGKDTFVFRAVAEGGDVITDFARDGDNDRITIERDGFQLNLAKGTLAAQYFQSNTTGAASDANDRFIYRTTDNTVWFDPDGSGAQERVMIADLQSKAVFTAADIVIF